MASDARPIVPARLVLGMVTLVLGLLFLADGADLLNAGSAMAFWPVGLVGLGLVVVLQPDPANRLVGAVLITAGIWLLLNNVGLWSYPFIRTWPYLLMIVGVWVLYRVRRLRAWESPDRAAGFAFGETVGKRFAPAAFTAGEFSAVGGRCYVDLTAAAIDETASRAIVDVFAVFGRIELVVPSGWQIDNRVLPLLARVDVPQQGPDGPPEGGPPVRSPLVIVRGSAICGDIAVAAVE
jgi:hypothetical protein